MSLSLFHRIREAFLVVLFALFVSGLVEYSSNNWNVFDQGAHVFIKTSPTDWELRMNSAESATYEVADSRMKSPCDLYLNDNEVVKNRTYSESGELPALLLNTRVLVLAGQNVFRITCSQQDGFAGGMADQPFLTTKASARVLGGLRILFLLFLGPFFSLFLFGQILGMGKESTSRGSYGFRYFPPLIFSIVGLLYFLSLDRISWLFLKPSIATDAHILIRVGFSWAFLNLVNKQEKIGNWFNLLFSVTILAFVPTMVFFPASVVSFYKIIYLVFPLSAALATFQLFKDDSIDSEVRWLRNVLSVWTVAQSLDFAGTWIDSGTYKGPTLAALVALCVVILQYRSLGLSHRIEIAIRNILAILFRSEKIETLLTQVAHTCAEAGGFSRISVYIDGYCIGKNAQPNDSLVRVMDSNYQKDMSTNVELKFETLFDSKMGKALDSGLPLISFSAEGGWHCVIPIGRVGTINLSDSSRRSLSKISDSSTLVKRIMPVIKALEDKLVVHAFRKGTFFEKAKTTLGYGDWKSDIGAIFLDVQDYSKNMRHFKSMSGGKDIYGQFISSTYLPSLLKALNGTVELERSEGDELFLVVVEALQTNADFEIKTATALAVEQVFEFVSGAGRTLCEDSGFPAVAIKLGVTVGQGSIVCDEYRVRTVGESINYASRLLSYAPSGGLVCSSELEMFFSDIRFHKGPMREYLEKKDIIRARPLVFRAA